MKAMVPVCTAGGKNKVRREALHCGWLFSINPIAQTNSFYVFEHHCWLSNSSMITVLYAANGNYPQNSLPYYCINDPGAFQETMWY